MVLLRLHEFHAIHAISYLYHHLYMKFWIRRFRHCITNATIPSDVLELFVDNKCHPEVTRGAWDTRHSIVAGTWYDSTMRRAFISHASNAVITLWFGVSSTLVVTRTHNLEMWKFQLGNKGWPAWFSHLLDQRKKKCRYAESTHLWTRKRVQSLRLSEFQIGADASVTNYCVRGVFRGLPWALETSSEEPPIHLWLCH